MLVTLTPIVISAVALAISIRSYQEQRRENLPFLRIRYCTVRPNPAAPGTGSLSYGDSERSQRQYMEAYFYRSLRDFLGPDLRILEISVTHPPSVPVDLTAIDFLLIENVHETAADRVDLEIARTDLAAAASRQRLELPGLEFSEVLAIPIRFEGRLLHPGKTPPRATVLTNIKVKNITYHSKDLKTSRTVIPRPPLDPVTVVTGGTDAILKIRGEDPENRR